VAPAKADAPVHSDWQLAVGPVVGGLMLDPGLADYRWDTGPAFQAGVQATVYRGRFSAGLRLMQSGTTQSTGIPGESVAPEVNLTSINMLGQVRAVRHWGVELWGSAHAGILHMGYDPDQMTFDLGGAGGPITVDFAPISEWDVGLGLDMRSDLTPHVALSLQVDGSTFALDTAHRSGNQIVNSRERFYTVGIRLQIAWLVSLS